MRRSFACSKALFCKELFVHRGECSLQLHVMLLCRTPQASCYCNHSIVQLAAAACCCWHRALQWRLEEANLEIFILQGSSYSLCKALVQSPSVFMSGSIFGLLGEPLLLIGEQQKPRKIVILGIKTRKIFWPAGAVSACGGSNAYFS